jgi:nucleoside-diphosphate-sugar epimerase
MCSIGFVQVQLGLLIRTIQASDVSFNSNAEDVVPWVIRAIHNVLQAASKNHDIQRVVMTSSAITALFPEPNKEGIVVREGKWWDPAYAVIKSSQHGWEGQRD